MSEQPAAMNAADDHPSPERVRMTIEDRDGFPPSSLRYIIIGHGGREFQMPAKDRVNPG
jgi:hypothetical protein